MSSTSNPIYIGLGLSQDLCKEKPATIRFSHESVPRIEGLLGNSPSFEFDITVCITEGYKSVSIKQSPKYKYL
jgi:hypothetical protein